MKAGPVYSEQAHCQDCYKCLRECPVKAIRVTGGHAVVTPERCIACGACVEACPSNAKRVREDLPLVEALLARGGPVAASLAPSYLSEFPGLAPGQLIAALRRLGFSAVSETALGAQEVSALLAHNLDRETGRLWLSTACPVAVDLVRKYVPERVADLTPLVSPALAHARLLREGLGETTAVVFIGPCIGKKLEAANHPDLLQAALTFEELRLWLDREGILPSDLAAGPGDRFALGEAAEGSLYPIEGGMIQATRLNMTSEGTRFLTLSGVETIRAALAELPEPGPGNLFLELLACEGGCVRGPKSAHCSSVSARMRVLDGVRAEPGAYPRPADLDVAQGYEPLPQADPAFSGDRLQEALLRIGKQGLEDELNCGGCGYDTCRALAAAILANQAEGRMCVSYLRQLAEKKANALLRTLPLGAVIVDQDLQIIESNEEFARIMGEDALTTYQAIPGLAGAHLDKFLAFTDRFRDVLAGGDEIIRQNITSGKQILSATIFTVEPRRVVGALLLDVTGEEERRKQVIGKAELVIQNMLGNVQEIAFSLGRNAARSEGILNSIIAEFSGQEPGRGNP
jgi:iron only hydrogenase large subunit-like protein